MATALSSTTPNDVERAVGFVNVLFTSSFFKPWKKRFLRLTVYPTLATLTMHKSPTVPSLGLLTLTPASTVRLLDHKGRTCLRIESDESVDHPDVWFVNPNTTDEIARWLDALRNAIATVQRSACTANTAAISSDHNQGDGPRLQHYPTSKSFGALPASQQPRRTSDPRPGSPDSMVFPESVVDLSPDELAASSLGQKDVTSPSLSVKPTGPQAGADSRARSDLGPGSRGPASTVSSSQFPPPRSLPPQVPPPCLPPNLDAPSPSLAKRGLPRSISTPHLDRTNVSPPRSAASTRPSQQPPVPALAVAPASMSQRSGPIFPNPRRPPPLQPSPSPSVDGSVDATDQVLASYGFSTMPSSYRPPWAANEPGAQGIPSAASSPTTTLNSMPDIPTLPPRPPSPHGSTPSPKTYVREVGGGQSQSANNRFSGERGLNATSQQRFSGERGLLSGAGSSRPGSPRSRARDIARSESPGSIPGSLDRAGLPPPSSSSSSTATPSGLAGGYSPMRRALPLHDSQPRSPQKAHFGRQPSSGNGGPISVPPPPASSITAGSSPLRSFRSDSPADSQYTAMASDLSSSVHCNSAHHPPQQHQQYSQPRQQSHSHSSDPIGHSRSGYSHNTMPASVRSTAATLLASPPSSRANNGDHLKSSTNNGGETTQSAIPARNRSLYPQDQDVSRAQRLRDRMNMVGSRENNSSGGNYSGASSLASTPTSSSMSLHSSPTPTGPSPASSNPSSPLAPHRDAEPIQPQFPPRRQVPMQQSFERGQHPPPQRSDRQHGDLNPRHDCHLQQHPQQHQQIRDQYRFDSYVQQYPHRQHANRQHGSAGSAQRQPPPQARVVEYTSKRH